MSEQFEYLHDEACRKNELFYTDPQTGCRVFTRLFHLKRGNCCGSACRHCPYDHQNVPGVLNREG